MERRDIAVTYGYRRRVICASMDYTRNSLGKNVSTSTSHTIVAINCIIEGIHCFILLLSLS